MQRKFDATLKTLLEESPVDWPILAGVPNPKVEVIDADISTISGAADKVLRVRGKPDWIMHFEFQAGPDASLPCRLNMYNGVLEDRHGLLVRSVVVLLRPEANLSIITGVYQRKFPEDTEAYRTFRYQVIRVWELPVEKLLSGGLGTLPLATIGAVTERELPALLQRMKKRLGRNQDKARTARLWTAVYVLMGLRYEQPMVEQLLQGVMGMKESATYQAIVAEGRAEGIAEGMVAGALREIRKVLLRQGQQHFGHAAPAWVNAALEEMHDLEQLELLSERLLEVSSWEDLLPRARKRSRQPKSDS